MLIVVGFIVGAVNLIVDPYNVFGTPRLEGFSQYKPATKNHEMLAKTYQLARAHPTTILIGSSSTHLGLDASDPAWPVEMRPVFNYGIPASYVIANSLNNLQEAVSLGGVKNAVVFLDFQNFLTPEGSSSYFGEDERRYHTLADGRPNPYRSLQVADDVFLSLATAGAFTDSLSTIFSQRTPVVRNLAPDGTASAADFVDAAHADGMHILFTQKNEYEIDRGVRLKKNIAGWAAPLPSVGTVGAIIGFAKAHDVRLTLVLAPHHADAFEIYWRIGLWPRIEQLKTELASLVATGDGNVTLWDFMDYSAFMTERIPDAGDRRTQTDWFWESTHFKKRLGTLMIERMFDRNASPLGQILTPENVAAHNTKVRSERNLVVCGAGPDRLLTAIERQLDKGCSPRQIAGGPD